MLLFTEMILENLGSPKVGPSDIPFNVNNKNIVLIDDVLIYR